jgi:hypothetical protein
MSWAKLFEISFRGWVDSVVYVVRIAWLGRREWEGKGRERKGVP